jgi:hypothetical protein
VEAALLQYIEKRGDKKLENPSAFFTNVMCKVTEDGALTQQKPKKQKTTHSTKLGKTVQMSTIFDKSKVDMSISMKDNNNTRSQHLEDIFPSLKRGRGRGAYMR